MACLRVPGVQVGSLERRDEKTGRFYHFQASLGACLRFFVYPEQVRVELYGMDRKKGVFGTLESVVFEIVHPDFERRVAEFVSKYWECSFPKLTPLLQV